MPAIRLTTVAQGGVLVSDYLSYNKDKSQRIHPLHHSISFYPSLLTYIFLTQRKVRNS